MNNTIKSNEQSPLYRFVLGLADDSVVLSHRLSEWCSNAPYLEEDIALSNIALDYVGRARMFYQYAAEVEGKGRSEDDLAYLRSEREFTNLLIHELPKGDFGFTMVRQFLLDAFYNLYLTQLVDSKDETIAAIAAKAIKETRYHLKRSEPWIRQLSEGTEESRSRIVRALEELKDFVGEMFLMEEWETSLVEQGIAIDRAALQPDWDRYIQGFLGESGIEFGDAQLQIRGGRNGIHTEHLGHMLSEMQYLQRTHPGMEW
ncbi:MAG: phenylacetate-CoA oxygenase subunit PaaC [Algicola sp.]|nr:phenylacetate-CoA oxygenase subunit PaaC [Algicola sp.]